MSSSPHTPPPPPPGIPPGRSPGRSTPEERQHALMLLASGMKAREVASSVGRSYEAIRLWRKKAEAEGTMPVPPVAAAGSSALSSPASPVVRCELVHAPTRAPVCRRS